MLKDINTGEEIDRIPHKETWDLITDRLSEEELDGIFQAIEESVDQDEIKVAGWVPGSNWTYTPFFPIYEKGAKCDHKLAGMMFGLIVWVYFQNRPDMWGFGRYDLSDQEVNSLTYFKLGE